MLEWVATAKRNYWYTPVYDKLNDFYILWDG